MSRIISIVCFTVLGFLSAVKASDLQKAKELFAKRDDKASLEEAIKIMEGLLEKQADYETAVLLSRSYNFLAEYAQTNDDRLSVYDKGAKAGEKALNTIPAFSEALKAGKKEEEAVKLLTKENIDALYWTAANLARWAKFTSFTKKVSSKARVRYLWDKVTELDPVYNYGGAYRFFGGYYALVPTITGENDPVKSKEMFDKAIAAAPQFLDTKVLYAEAYATHPKVKNRELFKQTLTEIINTDISKHPEIMPENKMAQEKAKKLLEQEASLFE